MSKRLGLPPAKEFRGHLLCNTNSGAPPMQKTKSKRTNNIQTYTRNHPSQNESTDRRHARNDFLLITTHPKHNSPPKQKTKYRSVYQQPSQRLTDVLVWSCCRGSKLPIPFFSMTFPNCYTFSPSIDSIHIRSINWLYGAYKAEGIPTVKGSPDKEGGRVFWITHREESYWGSMAVLSPMLAYVELQTLPPARTATVTDVISPG